MSKQNALQELTFIKEIIAESRRDMIENGIGYIFLGSVFLAGFLSTYIGLLNDYFFKYAWNWILLILLAWLVLFSGILKGKSAGQARSFSRKLLQTTWMSFGISLSLIGFAGTFSGGISGYSLIPLTAVLLGTAYMISSVLYGYHWVGFIAAGWWVSALIMFLYPGRYLLLLISILLIVLQIIPGIVLYQKSQRDAS